jgi:DNA invertase Pin-like site-specific DNA recombinase
MDKERQLSPTEGLRTALYVRAACITQTTLDEQREVLERYAERNDLRVVQRYIEGGFSGRTQGPKQKEMLETVLAGTAGFSVILMRDVSRWGRWDDCCLSAYYEFMCLREGVRVQYMQEEENDRTELAGKTIAEVIRRAVRVSE